MPAIDLMRVHGIDQSQLPDPPSLDPLSPALSDDEQSAW